MDERRERYAKRAVDVFDEWEQGEEGFTTRRSLVKAGKCPRCITKNFEKTKAENPVLKCHACGWTKCI